MWCDKKWNGLTIANRRRMADTNAVSPSPFVLLVTLVCAPDRNKNKITVGEPTSILRTSPVDGGLFVYDPAIWESNCSPLEAYAGEVECDPPCSLIEIAQRSQHLLTCLHDI